MPQNFVSRYNNLLAVKGRGTVEYTAGPNIDISDYIISGRDWTSDINAAIKGVKGSGFSAATAWVDSQGYLTAHQDVSDLPYVQNSALDFSPQNLISGISGTGLYATSADAAFLAETANYALYSEEAGSAASAATAEYSMSATSAHSALYAQSANSALGSQTALISLFALSSQSAGLVTEGWDYTDPENSAISGLISGYNGSAFYDLGGGDANCPWISGSKVIGNVTADFGNTYQLISSFDFSGDKNHHISLKGSWITFPTTGHIASALDEKLNSAAFDLFLTSEYSPRLTELYGRDSYISGMVDSKIPYSALSATPAGYISSIGGSGLYAVSSLNAFTAETAIFAENTDVSKTAEYVSGGWEYDGDNYITGYSGSAFKAYEGGDVTPWISGAKDIGSTTLGFGDTVQIVSSFDLSGYRNHAIGLKGSVIALPTTGHIASALDEKLDASSFNNFIDNEYSTAKSQFINNDNYLSGKIDALSGHADYISGQVDNKLDNSAFTAYTATAVQGIEYTGIAPIVVNNELHMISAQSAKLSVRNPLYFVEDSTSATTIGIYGSATMDSAAVTGTAQYALTTAGWAPVIGGGGGSTADVLYDHMWGSSYGIFANNSASYTKIMSSAMNLYDKVDFIFGNYPDEISNDTYIPHPNPTEWYYGDNGVYTNVINNTGAHYICVQTNNSGTRYKSRLKAGTVPGDTSSLLSVSISNGTQEKVNSSGMVTSIANVAVLYLKKVIGYKY